MECRCRYTRINGARCTMPALNQGELCFEHEQRKRLSRLKRLALPEPNAAGPLVSFAYMDDHASILANLNAIVHAFTNHQIDFRQVSALTYLMQTCLKTLRQMNELEAKISAEEVVRDATYDDSGMALAADTGASAAVSDTYQPTTNNTPVSKHLQKSATSTPLFSNTSATDPGLHLIPSRHSHTRVAPAPRAPKKPANSPTRHAAKRRQPAKSAQFSVSKARTTTKLSS